MADTTGVRTMSVGPFEIRWTVNFGHVLTLLGMLAAGLWGFAETRKDIATVRQTAQQLDARFNRHELSIASDLLSLQARVGKQEVATGKVETQLDSIAENVARILAHLDGRR